MKNKQKTHQVIQMVGYLYKHKYINQWSESEYSEIILCMYVKGTEEGAETTQWKKECLNNKWC